MGWHPVMEALDAGKEFQKVLIQRDEKGERTTALVAQLRGLNIPVQRVPKEKLNRITVKNHQGIVAFLSPISYQPLEELIARAYEAGETPLLVALDGVTVSATSGPSRAVPNVLAPRHWLFPRLG